MKYIFAFTIGVLFFSCTEKDKKKDIELNTYYSQYVYIYNNYDSLGIEKSIKLLDEYIEVFPNAQNAYLFKAFLLAKSDRATQIDSLFEKALSYDSTNADVYIHWASLLLLDTNLLTEAKEKNEIGKSLDSANIMFRNNDTWIYLFENNTEKALENASKCVQETNAGNNSLLRTLLIASLAANNDSIYQYTFPLVSKKDSSEVSSLKAYQENQINLPTLYKKLTK